MYGSILRVNEENPLYGLLGASEQYLLEPVEGNPIVLHGTKEGTVKSEITEFKMFGWSQQIKTYGYQIFNKANAEDNKYQQYNISENQLSIVTANNFWITGFIEVEQNTTYTINTNDFAGVYYNANKEPIQSEIIYNSSTFTTPQNTKYIVLTFEKSLYPFTFRNSLMLNEGVVRKQYEEYSGCYESPSAEYPQPIDGVGTNGNTVIMIGSESVETEVKLYGIQSEENPTYIDEYGNGWIADELNLLTGKIIRRLSAEDETKEVQILSEPVEETADIDVLNVVINEDTTTIENNAFAHMLVVYKAYSGGV